MTHETIVDADLLRVPIGTGAVHVERYGHGGPPIVLLHGFGTNAFLWRAVGPGLAEAGYTAFAIDMLGYGESDRPMEADFGIAAQAEHIDRALTALRLTRAVVAGVDVGGGVALRLAVTRPERVERLVLLNSVAFDVLPGREIRAMQRSTARFAVRVASGVMGAAPLLTPLLEGSVADLASMPPRLVARYLAPYVGREGVKQLLVLARSLRVSELEDLDLRRIEVPTLVIWGDADQWLDSALAERLINTIPDAHLERISGVARLSPEEAPERVVALLLAFLRGRAGE
ncbi:MAG: alpha/beta fold hydrolase [Gemmatimonadaceae bacterium]